MLGFDFQKIAMYSRFESEFEDLGLIGNGGFANVHRVRHKTDARQYACKIIKIKPSHNKQDTEDHFYKVLGEVKTHSTLSHQNVLKYYGCWIELTPYSHQQKLAFEQEEQEIEDHFEMVIDDSFASDQFIFGEASQGNNSRKQIKNEEDNSHKDNPLKFRVGDGSSLTDYKEIKVYVLTELCQNSLQIFIQRRNEQLKNQKNVQERVEWQQDNFKKILQLVEGLKYLHTNRVIHRDIKLQNIMIGQDGACKIIDFGLARKTKLWKSSIEDSKFNSILSEFQNDEEGEEFSSSVGTKLFSSPQQATSEKYDHRTDIYSLALVILLLFSTFSTAHQQKEILENTRKRNFEGVVLPLKLKSILFKCLGPENERASLREIQSCVKQLSRDYQTMKELVSDSQVSEHNQQPSKFQFLSYFQDGNKREPLMEVKLRRGKLKKQTLLA